LLTEPYAYEDDEPTRKLAERIIKATRDRASQIADSLMAHDSDPSDSTFANAIQQLLLPQEALYMTPSAYFSETKSPDRLLKWLSETPEECIAREFLETGPEPEAETEINLAQLRLARQQDDGGSSSISEAIKLPFPRGNLKALEGKPPITMLLPPSAAALVTKPQSAAQSGRLGMTETLMAEARAAQWSLLPPSARQRSLVQAPAADQPPKPTQRESSTPATTTAVKFGASSPSSGTLSSSTAFLPASTQPTPLRPSAPMFVQPPSAPTLMITSQIFVPLTKQQIQEEERKERERLKLEKKRREEEKKAELRAEKERAKLAEKEEKERLKLEKEAQRAQKRATQASKKPKAEADAESSSSMSSSDALFGKRTADELSKLEPSAPGGAPAAGPDHESHKRVMLEPGVDTPVEAEPSSAPSATAEPVRTKSTILDDPMFDHLDSDIRSFVIDFSGGVAVSTLTPPAAAKQIAEGVYSIVLAHQREIDPADGRVIERKIVFEADYNQGLWKKKVLKKKGPVPAATAELAPSPPAEPASSAGQGEVL